MEVVHYFTRNQKQLPATGLNDSIVQLPDIPPCYECNVEVALRFDSTLDSEKLQKSLKRLLEIGNWRQLGGRLRRRDVCLAYPSQAAILTTHRPIQALAAMTFMSLVNSQPNALHLTIRFWNYLARLTSTLLPAKCLDRRTQKKYRSATSVTLFHPPSPEPITREKRRTGPIQIYPHCHLSNSISAMGPLSCCCSHIS